MIAQCKLDESIIQYVFFHLMDDFYNDAINMYTWLTYSYVHTYLPTYLHELIPSC
jgi:hypothetical protein